MRRVRRNEQSGWRERGVKLLILFLLAVVLPLSAATPSPDVARNATWPQDASDIPADPAVKWGVLPNGMRYALKRNRQPPGAVSMRLSIEFGSLDESEDERGLAHFIEHMAFNGSTHVPEGEMVPALERLGLAFGADTNAITSRAFTTFMFDLPTASNDAADKSLFLLREIASELTFEPAAIDRERGIIGAEARRADTFDRRSNDQQLAFLIPGSYAAQRPPIGVPEIVELATRAQLTSLYDRFYRPENATLVIAGDFDVAAMSDKIASAFGTWEGKGEAGKRLAAAYNLPPSETAALVIAHPDGGDALSVFALSPFQDHADTWKARHDDMLLSIATGAVNRRLAEAANSADRPFLRAGLFWSDLLGAAHFASGSVSVAPGGWKPGLEALEQAWRRAREHGVTQSEVDEQIAVIRTALQNAADRADTRATSALAASITASLQDDSVFSSPSAIRDQFEQWMPTITTDAVNLAFRARMAAPAPKIVMLTSEAPPASERDLVTAWVDSEKIPVAAYALESKAAFPYTYFGRTGAIARDERRADLGARLIAFENNVRLNIKQTTFQKGSILVSLRIGEGGVAFEHAPLGLAGLMSAYSEGGLETLTIDELERSLAGHTLQAGLSIGADTFGGVFSTTPRDLQLQLQVAAAYMTHPGYRPEAERDWRQSIVLGWPALNKDARAAFASRGTRWLLSGDKRFGAASDDGAIMRTFAELKTYLDPIFSDAAIEIAIVGDVDETAAIEAVAATFGALPRSRRDPRPVRSDIPVAFEHGSVSLVHGGEPTQALLKLYWPVDVNPDADPQSLRTLGLVASVMRLKLVASVREALGASYAPTAGFSSSIVYPGLNYLYADVEMRPDDLGEIEGSVLAITAALRSGEITQDELERARAPALEQLPQHASSNAYWLSVLAEAQGQPKRAADLDLKAIASQLESVTVSDLAAVARRWLTDANMRSIRILPPGAGDRP
jgi:zinc protease